MDTDWDVNQYRTESESEEHWNLRLNFMNRWKQEIPEDRLVCLARVFSNIEFLGCRYPAPVMRQVAELSKEVASDYREKKKMKIQRTFVSASDAAGDKAKGTFKRSNNAEASCSKPKKMMFVAAESNDTLSNTNLDSNNMNIKDNGKMNTSHNNIRENRGNRSHVNQYNKSKPIITNKYGNIILFEHSPTSCISKIIASCQTCKVPQSWNFKKEPKDWSCECIINNIVVSVGHGETQKIAKDESAKLGWEILQQHCYTVVVIQKHISKDDKTISVKGIRNDNVTPPINPLDVKVESKVASRIMKLMGWGGGGLGVTGSGINEPIAPNLKQIHRAGLGSSNDQKPIKFALRKIIIDFKNNGTTDYDLVFANEFGKEERAEMHKLAQRNGLKSRSYGQDDERYLVISKPTSPQQLVQTLLDCGGSNDKYQLISPKDS